MNVAISYGPELDLAIPDVENTFCNQQIDDLDRSDNGRQQYYRIS